MIFWDPEFSILPASAARVFSPFSRTCLAHEVLLCRAGTEVNREGGGIYLMGGRSVTSLLQRALPSTLAFQATPSDRSRPESLPILGFTHRSSQNRNTFLDPQILQRRCSFILCYLEDPR